MTKPLHENLDRVLMVTDDGDLVPVMDVAGTLFSDLINAVTAQQKAGSLTLKIAIKPSTAGALAVKAEVSAKKPQGATPESLLWATPEGNLIAEDPRQQKFDFKQVTPAPVRELKTITK